MKTNNHPQNKLKTQIVDVTLPFVNQQYEAARRTYLEKHPLGRDKEQQARLRQDLGRPAAATAAGPSPATAAQPAVAGAATAGGEGGAAAAAAAAAAAGGLVKPERVIDYSVSSSSALVLSAAPGLTLKSGLDAVGAGDKQGAAGAKGGGGSGGGAAAAAAAAAAAQMAGWKGGPPPNTLRLTVKTKGTGLYPAQLTLASEFDVRVVSVEVSAQSLGQTFALELECPARQQVRARMHVTAAADGGCSPAATLFAHPHV